MVFCFGFFSRTHWKQLLGFVYFKYTEAGGKKALHIKSYFLLEIESKQAQGKFSGYLWS